MRVECERYVRVELYHPFVVGLVPVSKVRTEILASMWRFRSPAIVVMMTQPSGISVSLDAPDIDPKCSILVVLASEILNKTGDWQKSLLSKTNSIFGSVDRILSSGKFSVILTEKFDA